MNLIVIKMIKKEDSKIFPDDSDLYTNHTTITATSPKIWLVNPFKRGYFMVFKFLQIAEWFF